VKAYFSDVLHVKFPGHENPADIIIDACNFESARKMATQGIWRTPPQRLRSLLVPTPQVVDEECKLHWQQEEFGRMLGELWADFASRHRVLGGNESQHRSVEMTSLSHTAGPLLQAVDLDSDGEQYASVSTHADGDNAVESLGHEAHTRAESFHWAQQAWLNLTRALLITSRIYWKILLPNTMMTVVALVGLACAFPGWELKHAFLSTTLLFLLVSLTQSFAAQRIFGTFERDLIIREAGVSSLAQTCCAFLGRDLASIAEMLINATVVTLAYWPLSASFVSGSDLFAISFALIYAVWGFSHIVAIVFNRQVAMIASTCICGLAFLFAGLKPEAERLMASFNGKGEILLLLSPIRWSMSHYLYRQVTGWGSTFMQPQVRDLVSGLFRIRGYSLDHLTCPNVEGRILERWHKGQGMICHNGQLFLLGFLFRLLAVMSLLVMTGLKVSGGQLPMGTSCSARSRLLRDGLIIFIIFFFVLQVLLLGQTY